MRFNDLEEGDVFVLKWWLSAGPAMRHYLVVGRDGSKLRVLRLEDTDHKVIDLDAWTFDENIAQGELTLVEVYRFNPSSTPFGS